MRTGVSAPVVEGFSVSPCRRDTGVSLVVWCGVTPLYQSHLDTRWCSDKVDRVEKHNGGAATAGK